MEIRDTPRDERVEHLLHFPPVFLEDRQRQLREEFLVAPLALQDFELRVFALRDFTAECLVHSLEFLAALGKSSTQPRRPAEAPKASQDGSQPLPQPHQSTNAPA